MFEKFEKRATFHLTECVGSSRPACLAEVTTRHYAMGQSTMAGEHYVVYSSAGYMVNCEDCLANSENQPA